MPISNKTLVRLSERMSDAFSHTGIDALFFEYGMQAGDPGNMTNKVKRSLALLQTLGKKLPPQKAQETYMEIANRVLGNEWVRNNSEALFASLSLDGLEWGGDRLVASDAGPAAVAPEISALEKELKNLGLPVAGTHYGQAVDNFTDGNFEAANGQLRSFLEDLFKGAARLRGQQQDVGPQAALDYLRKAGVLDDHEWAIFRALWNGSQDNGPHAGLTDAEEARFRMHTATAAGRYLARKVQTA